MKEQVTKFDLEAAFKALDEIDIPKVKGIRPNRLNLTESTRRVDRTSMLIEDYYDITDQNDLEAASEEREGEIAKAKLARIEKIVDLDADNEEDLLPSYVGKTIIQCPQCMTLFYKNPEDIVPSEEDPTIVNVEEKCQHCGNESGYSVIGKVAEETPEELTASTEEIPAEEGNEEESDLEIPAEGEGGEEEFSVEEETPEGEEELTLEEVPEEETEETEEEEEEKNESLNNSKFLKDAKKKNELASENTSTNLTLNESAETDFEDKMKQYNIYIEYIKNQIKFDEAALKKAGDNELVKAAIQRRINDYKKDLEDALPPVLKDITTSEDLPTAEEIGVDEKVDIEEEPKEEEKTDEKETKESLNNSKTLKNAAKNSKLKSKNQSKNTTLNEAANPTLDNYLDKALEASLKAKKQGIKKNTNVLLTGNKSKFTEIMDWAKSKDINILYIDALNPNLERAFRPLERQNSVLVVDNYDRANLKVKRELLLLIHEHAITDSSEPEGTHEFPNLLFTIACIRSKNEDRNSSLSDAELVRFPFKVNFGFDESLTEEKEELIGIIDLSGSQMDQKEQYKKVAKENGATRIIIETSPEFTNTEAACRKGKCILITADDDIKANRKDLANNPNLKIIKVKHEDLNEANTKLDLSDSAIDDLFNSPEFKKPISDREVRSYLDDPKMTESIEEIDIDEIDELDESAFNKVINSYLNEVYKNVDHFEATSCEIAHNTLVVEGLIHFNSSKTRPTTFEFTKKSRSILEGYNKEFSNDEPIYKLDYKVRNTEKGKVLISENLKYNYKINNIKVCNKK